MRALGKSFGRSFLTVPGAPAGQGALVAVLLDEAAALAATAGDLSTLVENPGPEERVTLNTHTPAAQTERHEAFHHEKDQLLL